jgi:xanthine/CO dehydrogenase XdhC/CoxF family maturation factor
VFSPDKKAAQPGTRHVVSENGATFGSDKALLKQAAFQLEQKKPAVVEYGDHTVLYQYLPPAQRLVVVGGGNDAQPIVATAALLGWSVTVVDGRPAYAAPRRFPGAERVVLAKPDALLREVDVDERTAVVLLTHNYNYDLAALEQLLPTACPYIGVLGPKKKLHRMLEELEENGITVDEEAMQRIYGPVGLDIGAETAEEIALSIVAEIKAVFAGRQGRFLKDRAAEIHQRQP